MYFFTRIALGFFLLSVAACSNSGTSNNNDDDNNTTPADIIITVNNVGNSAWEVTNIEGDNSAATLNENNTTITVQENMRYRIINNGGSVHPFGLQDSGGNYLLAQGNNNGSFEDDADVDFVSGNDGVFFTVTAPLAAELATYNCQTHVVMEGSMNVE